MPEPFLGTRAVLSALIRSAEKRFHISTNTLHEHTDPASLMQRLLDMGEVRAEPRACALACAALAMLGGVSGSLLGA